MTTVVADIGLPTALANAAGRVTNAAVGSLLSDPAVRVFASRLAVTVLGGGDVVGEAISAVLTQRPLQAAIGTAVGRGLGSLFGDNPLGTVVGWVTGGAVTQLLGLIGAIGSIFIVREPIAGAEREEEPVTLSGKVSGGQRGLTGTRGPVRVAALAA